MKKVIFTILVIIGFAGLLLFSGEEKAEKAKNQYTIPPVVKDVGGWWYIYVPGKGPYDGISEKYKIIKAEIKKQGLKTMAAPFVLYWNHPKVSEHPERYMWAACVQVAEDAKVNPPLKKAFFKKRKAAFCTHTGPIKDIVQSNDILDKFIDDKYLITVWPVYEVFHPDGKIDIVHPVAKIEY